MVSTALHGLCGFFFQIMPCALFCLYPFYDSFRYPRKRVMAAFGFIMAVMAAAFTWFYVALDVPSGYDGNTLPLEMIFLLTVGLLLAIYLLCIRARIIHRLFIFILALNYGFLMTELVSYACAFFPVDYNYMYSTAALAFHFLFNAVLCYPMLQVLRRARRAFRSEIEPAVWRGLTLIPGTFFVAMLLFYELPLSADVPDNHVLSIFTKVMDILMLFLCSAALRTMEIVQRRTNERVYLEAAVRDYKAMAESNEKLRETRHEIGHHIAALSILLQNRDYAGAEDYLEKVSPLIAAAPGGSYTPHVLLNSMLSGYRERAAADGIEIRYDIQVPESVAMEDLDLCQFLSNLLDNALEANLQLEPEKRQLSLTIRQSDRFLYFCCKNPCDPSRLRRVNGRFGTGKPDEAAHGYGISIMKRIAEKYNGVFRTTAENDVFTAAANLCMPAAGKE